MICRDVKPIAILILQRRKATDLGTDYYSCLSGLALHRREIYESEIACIKFLSLATNFNLIDLTQVNELN